MKAEAPNHYAQYVMNSFEEMEQDDFVFNYSELLDAKKLGLVARPGYDYRIMGADIARFGNDKSAAAVIQQVGALYWKVVHVEQWEHRDLNYTTGRILALAAQHHSADNIVDEDGLGGGPLDFIMHGRDRRDFVGFRNRAVPYSDDREFVNPRTRAAFRLRDMVSKGHIEIPDDELINELMTLRFKFTNDGRRALVSKDEMRKQGIKSPNKADALLMAASLIDDVQRRQDIQYMRVPATSRDEDLFSLAGVR